MHPHDSFFVHFGPKSEAHKNMRLPVSTLALAAALFIATSAQGKPCLIDLALCGYATAGDASWMINLNDAFVMESPHSYVQMQDGMWEADILLKGKGTAEMCVALWYDSGEQCPYIPPRTHRSPGFFPARRPRVSRANRNLFPARGW
jgi:hypothetical protein